MLATVELADWWEAVGREACCAEPGDRLPLVHLWEDEWRARQPIVHSRLLAMAGRSRRLMARKLQVRRIDAATLEGFLLQHHLWGPTQARFRYGLFTKPSGPEGEEGEELVAVASFSARRNVQRAGRTVRLCLYPSHQLPTSHQPALPVTPPPPAPHPTARPRIVFPLRHTSPRVADSALTSSSGTAHAVARR